MAHDEPVDLPGNQLLKYHGACPEGLSEKGVDGRQIADDRRLAQTTLLNEEALVSAYDLRDRVGAVRVFRDLGYPSFVTQVAQQLPTRRRFALRHSPRSAGE